MCKQEEMEDIFLDSYHTPEIGIVSQTVDLNNQNLLAVKPECLLYSSLLIEKYQLWKKVQKYHFL